MIGKSDHFPLAVVAQGGDFKIQRSTRPMKTIKGWQPVGLAQEKAFGKLLCECLGKEDFSSGPTRQSASGSEGREKLPRLHIAIEKVAQEVQYTTTASRRSDVMRTPREILRLGWQALQFPRGSQERKEARKKERKAHRKWKRDRLRQTPRKRRPQKLVPEMEVEGELTSNREKWAEELERQMEFFLDDRETPGVGRMRAVKFRMEAREGGPEERPRMPLYLVLKARARLSNDRATHFEDGVAPEMIKRMSLVIVILTWLAFFRSAICVRASPTSVRVRSLSSSFYRRRQGTGALGSSARWGYSHISRSGT